MNIEISVAILIFFLFFLLLFRKLREKKTSEGDLNHLREKIMLQKGVELDANLKKIRNAEKQKKEDERTQTFSDLQRELEGKKQ